MNWKSGLLCSLLLLLWILPARAERWAVLMNGGYNQPNNHPRYWNDLSNIYITLVQIYGYADDHILVLCSDGLNPAPDQSNGQNSNPDLDGDGDPDINYACVLVNVDQVFAWLAANLTSVDQLFIFSTDHGGSFGGWNAYQNLWNMETLTDTHFAQLLNALPPGIQLVCTLQPSYSGGFLDNVVIPPGPVIASSACAYNQASYPLANQQYSEYAFHWTAAVNGHDAYGAVVNADYNNNGIVSMDEAFHYAQTHDTLIETPQYGEYPAGLGPGVSLWPATTGPLLLITNQFVDDIGGNNNGKADPGENILMRLTLGNLGQGTATGIVGTLSSRDDDVTITQNQAVYPNLMHFEQGVGTPDYLLSISSLCPVGHAVECSLHIASEEGYTQIITTSFMVGDPLAAPTGPDVYGYRAWDDIDNGQAHPYAWTEIAPQHGGPGTVLFWPDPDDGTQTATLPFSFRYYGHSFSQISVCTNGWIAFGATNSNDWTNSGIPNADGPPNMVALFWRDLDAGYGGSQIATYFNSANHTFTVEYDSIAFYVGQTQRQTFQAILYDPIWYPTSTGDGVILVQYKRVTNANSSTFGIENQTQTDGIQYGFNGTWDEHAARVANYRAITYTTNMAGPPPPIELGLTPIILPIVIPAQGGSFQYHAMISNTGGSPVTFNAWVMQFTPGGFWQGPMLGPVNLTIPGGVTASRNRTQNVPGSAAPGTYIYRGYVGIYFTATKWDSSSFNYIKTADGNGPWVGDWDNWGESFDPYLTETNVPVPQSCSLEQNYPNPFNPTTAIRYQLPANSRVSLKVYDLTGRLVATLMNGWQEAGTHEVTFDGSKLVSGLYFVRMEAGDFSQVRKIMLVK